MDWLLSNQSWTSVQIYNEARHAFGKLFADPVGEQELDLTGHIALILQLITECDEDGAEYVKLLDDANQVIQKIDAYLKNVNHGKILLAKFKESVYEHANGRSYSGSCTGQNQSYETIITKDGEHTTIAVYNPDKIVNGYMYPAYLYQERRGSVWHENREYCRKSSPDVMQDIVSRL